MVLSSPVTCCIRVANSRLQLLGRKLVFIAFLPERLIDFLPAFQTCDDGGKNRFLIQFFCPVPSGQGLWMEAAKDDFINMKGGLHYPIIWQILTLNSDVQSSSTGVQRLKSKEIFLEGLIKVFGHTDVLL